MTKDRLATYILSECMVLCFFFAYLPWYSCNIGFVVYVFVVYTILLRGERSIQDWLLSVIDNTVSPIVSMNVFVQLISSDIKFYILYY